MKKKKYLLIWVMILLILFQSTAFATKVQDINNTAPIANFTVEKSRNVKLLVLSDYTGTASANLKNSITSMKSELNNDAKIDVEYVTNTDIEIGTQQGFYKQQTWGMLAHGNYRITGTERKINDYYYTDVTTDINRAETVSFSHSPTITLPEGESPTVKYNVPVRYTHTTGELQTSPYNSNCYMYEKYIFYDKNGAICEGKLSALLYAYRQYTASNTTEDYTITQQPNLIYDDFWTVMDTYDQPVTNTVLGWDLSKINYDVAEGTDTYVIFAMNNESTDYYTPKAASAYRLGQLRSDETLGKYVKATEARVYSICSENFENINLSTNPQYPITLTSAKQNISVKDLINTSIDGRNLGSKNVSGLVNKIKESIKKPTGSNIDIIVATDKATASTNSFIDSIKNDISSDVALKTNVVDTTSLEDTSIWTKYVVNRDYKNLTNISNKNVNIILTGNGELWAQGSNSIGSYYDLRYGVWSTDYSEKFGLFGLSTTVTNYSKFVNIGTEIKDAVFTGTTIVILKNDGTLWSCGYCGYKEDRNYVRQQFFTNQFTKMTEFSDIKSISLSEPYNNSRNILTVTANTGKLYLKSLEHWGEAIAQTCIAPGAEYVYTYIYDGNSSNRTIYYVLTDGRVYYYSIRRDYYDSSGYLDFKFPSPIKKFCSSSGLGYCEDNNIYNLNSGQCLNTVPIKKIKFINDSYIMYIGTDSNCYSITSAWNSNYAYYNKLVETDIDEILFYGTSDYGSGYILRKLNRELVYTGKLGYDNLLCMDTAYASKLAAEYSQYHPNTFEASVDGLAADYLQIGNHFAGITKSGEIIYVTAEPSADYTTTVPKLNKLGKIPSLVTTSTEAVKAFSKTRILNTALREGSERFFIYISDNVEKDTYFKSPSDYFLFGNLDSTILNYLKTNNFNIYVVTPAQALDLKLQYPYVPVNKQQYTLRKLVNNATKDSSICSDINTVRTLISRKYSTYTKQGSTTLTLIVDEEGMNYKLVYRDFENDPKYSDKWRYTHNQTYFDNPNGLASYSGQWLTTPEYSFSKVGKYTVVSQFRDNPKNVSSFDNYRLWSNISAPAIIIVHRRPIAAFNTQVVSKVGTTVNLSYLDYSYDLDHNITRADLGIATRSWQYRKEGADTWIEGKPTNLVYNTGVYQIRLKVKDIEGAWSKPYIDTIDTANLVPTIDASPIATRTSPYKSESVSLTITASDNGEDDLVLAASSYSPKTRYALTNSATKPSKGWINLPTKAYSLPTITKEGTYYLHMEAYDNAGQSFYRVRGPYTVETLKASHFYITMMLDIGWRSYYFDVDNGIDDNHDGESDRYPRRANTDIGTLKMPINYFNLVGHARTYIKAGYKVKGKIDIIGNPDMAEFNINYIKEGKTFTDTVYLTKTEGDTYIFEWIIPLETDTKTFVSFDLVTKKGDTSYGNEKWTDIWDARNTARWVFYVKGKATDDLLYVQSQ